MEIQRTIHSQQGNLRGVIHRSKTKDIKGVVLILHGYFSSNKNGPARLYIELARILSENGYCVWRFDCFGIGESDGDFIESTFDSQLMDYNILLNVAHKEEETDCFILCGHSVGANMALYVANENRSLIKKLILISPAFGKFSGKKPLINKKQWKELNEKGFAFRRGFFVSLDYIKRMQDKGSYKLLTDIKIPFLITIGDKDQYYSYDLIYEYLNEKNNCHIVKIKKADHNFLNRDARNMLLHFVLVNFLLSSRINQGP